MPENPPSRAPVPSPQQQLRRKKLQALMCLVAALAGLVLSLFMGRQGGWAWLEAFCEAAVVGALADWFAVVALFRHPLGVPLPHTAIVPRKKLAIAEGLGDFVRDHFLEPAKLVEQVSALNPAAQLGDWLTQPDNAARVSGSVRAMVGEALALLDEQAVRAALSEALARRVNAWDAAATVQEVMALLTREGRHHEVLDVGLRRLAAYVDEPQFRDMAAELLVKHARKEWPTTIKVVNWVKPVDDLADKLASRLAQTLIDELAQVLSTPEHPARQRYEAWFQVQLARLRDDPAVVDQVNVLKDEMLQHPAVRSYLDGLWQELFQSVREDLAAPDSRLVVQLQRSLQQLGGRIQTDAGLREAIDEHIRSGVWKLAGSVRGTARAYIVSTIRAWDDRELVERLELSVGADLQWIRMNGTLVGGVVGLILHALILALGL